MNLVNERAARRVAKNCLASGSHVLVERYVSDILSLQTELAAYADVLRSIADHDAEAREFLVRKSDEHYAREVS